MRVLLAFDKFKDALTAREACEAAADGLRHHPDWELDLCPLTDGGDGFCEILTAAVGGHTATRIVHGPRGEPVTAKIGLVPLATVPARALERLAFFREGQQPADGIVAVIEMAAASGLALLAPHDRDLWRTSSSGTGELIRAAAEMGACGIVLGVGGSATNDLGLGALSALGVECRDAHGELIAPPTPERFHEIDWFTLGSKPKLPPIRLACDVRNPVLGLRGATLVFGPQKGLNSNRLGEMEASMSRVARLMCQFAGLSSDVLEIPGAGAAGGIAFGLTALSKSELVSGSALVSDWLNLDRRVAAADVIITGEGSFDEASLEGKGPGAMVIKGKSLAKPVHIFAGQTLLEPQLTGSVTLRTITLRGTPLPQALKNARANLTEAIKQAFSGAPVQLFP